MHCFPSKLVNYVQISVSVCSVKVCNYAGHVVCSYAVLCSWGYNIFKYLFNHLVNSLFICFKLRIVFIYFFAAFFVCQAVPDAVTCQNDEFISRLAFGDRDVWVARNCLVSWLQIRLIFILEISEGSAECQIAIDSSILYKMIGLLDSIQLFLIFWLMVFTERKHFIIGKQN